MNEMRRLRHDDKPTPPARNPKEAPARTIARHFLATIGSYRDLDAGDLTALVFLADWRIAMSDGQPLASMAWKIDKESGLPTAANVRREAERLLDDPVREDIPWEHGDDAFDAVNLVVTICRRDTGSDGSLKRLVAGSHPVATSIPGQMIDLGGIARRFKKDQAPSPLRSDERSAMVTSA